MPEPANPIRSVSDTALWVAWYRAQESTRPDALFHDPFAAALAGERGKAIVDSIPGGRSAGWAMVVRSCLFDELLLRLIQTEHADAVLNLAAGLDARPWRLDLPPDLQWYDVDLPAMLDHKRGHLGGATPRCRYESRAADLADAAARQALFAAIGAAHERVIVMSEGLLIYLHREQAAALARDLAAQPAFRWWITDLASPALLKFVERRWAPRLREGNAPFRFGPAEGTQFFAPLGWHEVEYRSTWAEARRLKREMAMGWLWRLLGRFASAERRRELLRMSGTVLLGRGPQGGHRG